MRSGQGRRVLVTVTLHCLIALAVAGGQAPVDAKRLPEEMPHVAYETYSLPNGLRVVLSPDHRLPTVHVNLWYHVGSKNEPENRTGFAHLFEHMMFQGSKDAPGPYLKRIEKLGGSANGSTNEDRTEYWETVPAGSLEYVLWLESDRLATLPDGLTEERLKNQIAVVENERRQRLENVPYGLLDVYLHENLYPSNHPYAHSVLGSHDHVKAATLAEVKDFFTTYYAPNNLTVAIVGDFDPAQAKQWMVKYFGAIAPAPPITLQARFMPRLQGEKIVDASDNIAEERTYFVWPAPPYLSADSMQLQLVRMILNRRLNADLRYNDQPTCSEVSVDTNTFEDASVFVVMTSVLKGVPLAEVEDKVDAEITLLAKDGPKPDELEAARNRFEFGELNAFESMQSTAELLNEGATYAGDPGDYTRRWQQLSLVTAEQVKAAARQYIDNKDRLLVRYHPDLAKAGSTPSPDRSVPPPVHPDPLLHAPEVRSAKLPNGLQIYVVQQRDVPKISVQLVTRAGVMLDPKGKDGLALITAASIVGPTTTRSGTQIRDGMESIGATTIGQGVNMESAELDFEVLAKNIDPAFVILSDVVLHPAFKQYSIDGNLRSFESSLAESRNEADAVATTAAASVLFGHDHPYARPYATEPGLQSLHREDMAAFYQTYWKPDNAALLFAGDISLEQATALAAKYLGGWTGHAPKPPAAPPLQRPDAGRVYLVDKPDAAQTYIMQMLPSVGADSTQRFPLTVVSSVWAGMASSRLSATLRETDGYSYGFNSSQSLFSDAGALVAAGSVQTDKTMEAVVELEKQLRLLHGEEPVSEAELQEARKSNLNAFSSMFETPVNITNRMSQLWTWRLPMSAMRGDAEGVDHASLAEVRAAASRYADPRKAILLLVGDRRRIEPGLRGLNLGAITVLDADGQAVQ